MTNVRRKRVPKGDRTHKRKFGLHNRQKDIDQIQDDMLPENIKKFDDLPIEEDLPGLGQYYCIECELRRLKEKPFTQKEAEMAVGLGTDNGKRISMDVSFKPY